MEPTKIRNFAIVAHIDHGKSSLSDCFLKDCNALRPDQYTNQVLDSMDLERERGITIKSQSVLLTYKSLTTEEYYFNLIDTPGHYDFSYEVSRCLESCEGVILVICAVSGIQAQTLAYYRLADQLNLKIIIVINKIDQTGSDVIKVRKQIEDLNLNHETILTCSAKNHQGIRNILEAIISYIPCPTVTDCNLVKARIIDSWFDNYLGVISLIRVYSGIIKVKSMLKVCSTQKSYMVEKLGVFTPKAKNLPLIKAGYIGFISLGLKDLKGAPVGDTLIEHNSCLEPLPNFKKALPSIYAKLFSSDEDNFIKFEKALYKLSLNDSSFSYQRVNSISLGSGFLCGFLGLLHLEIIHERLCREYNLELIITPPSVVYRGIKFDGQTEDIYSTQEFNQSAFKEIHEPIGEVIISAPYEFIGKIMSLCQSKFGWEINRFNSYMYSTLTYHMPLEEIISDFSDSLKSCTQGYGSFEYHIVNYQKANIAPLKILLNGEENESLTRFIRMEKSRMEGLRIVNKLKNELPRAQFQIKIQASFRNTIIARENISPLRKDVTAKCYGGDITRKRKLLDNQKKGKKKMASHGKVKVPSKIMISLIKKI